MEWKREIEEGKKRENRKNDEEILITHEIMTSFDCPQLVYKLIPHKLLVLEYNSMECLPNHPELEKFIIWV